LDARGVTVECPNFTFEDTPEGEFVETILAAGAQLERQQNKRQVVQKMKARLEAGYWTFNSHCIPGYKRQDTSSRDWVLVRQEPEASIIQEAFERFADGRLLEQVDVARFLEARGFSKKVYVSEVKRLFERSLYAGYVEYAQWGVERREGKHEAIVSKEVYEAVQKKLAGKTYSFTRKDVNEDFPLRGLVVCDCCSQKLTASWSTGRTKRYPYYRCKNKQCEAGNKSLAAGKVDISFGEMLKSVTPKDNIVALGEKIALDVWNRREQIRLQNSQKVTDDLKGIQSEITALTKRVVAAKSDTVALAYEAQIETLSLQEADLQAVLVSKKKPPVDFGTALAEVNQYIKSPYNIWSNKDLFEQRLVTRLVFVGDIPYHYESGFGTTNISPILKLYEAVETSQLQDVEMAGIEPASVLGW